MTKKQALLDIGGSLGNPSKMPGFSYGIPARTHCNVGGKLAEVEGSVCFGCYADNKNNYAYSSVKTAQARRLKSLEDLETWKTSMVFLIDRECTRSNEFYFRWHDSGDIQSLEHLEAIIWIAKELPHIKFWIPSKEYQLKNKHSVLPANLILRWSHPMINAIFAPGKYQHTSSVLKADKLDKAQSLCPAPQQENSCGDCRKCWDKSIIDITYKYH